VTGPAAATIVAKPYLSHARVLAHSFREHHPEIPFFALLADDAEGRLDPADEPYELLAFDDLGLDDAAGYRFRYEQQPLSYAMTPHLVDHLLGRGFDRVVFIKQESLVLDRLDPVLAALETSQVVLTPYMGELPAVSLQRVRTRRTVAGDALGARARARRDGRVRTAVRPVPGDAGGAGAA
jgi:hypothetical protein